MAISVRSNTFASYISQNPAMLNDPIQVRASKGVVPSNSPANDELGVPPPKDLKIFKDMLLNDPIISAGVDTTVDVTTFAGYDFFEKKSTAQAKKANKKIMDVFKNDLNWDEIQDNILRSMLTYGLAYLELRRDGNGKVRELHVLETPEIWIKHDEHGTIKGYTQQLGKPKTTNPVFETDEVVMFSWKFFGSSVWPLHPLEPVARDYATNLFANVVLQGVYKHMPPKLIYMLKSVSDTQRKKFIQNTFVAKQNPGIDLFAEGEFDVKEIKTDSSDLLNVLRYFQQRFLASLRVPGFFIGVSDESSNRGSSEARTFAYETVVRKLQQIIENTVNTKLLPELGFSTSVMKFNPFSLKDEKTIIENAERLLGMGVKKDVVAEFLTMRGLTIRKDDITEGMVGGKLKQDIDSMKRPRMDKKNEDLTSNLDRSGTSELSVEKKPSLEARSMYIREGYDQLAEEVLQNE